MRENLPNGRNLREFLVQTGAARQQRRGARVSEPGQCHCWVEERLLGELENGLVAVEEPAMQPGRDGPFSKRKDETLKKNLKCAWRRGRTNPKRFTHAASRLSVIFGTSGRCLHLHRWRWRRATLPASGRVRFLWSGLASDAQPRSNDAIAQTDTEVLCFHASNSTRSRKRTRSSANTSSWPSRWTMARRAASRRFRTRDAAGARYEKRQP